jgi:tetratricopeptide (TPR) repeat protein
MFLEYLSLYKLSPRPLAGGSELSFWLRIENALAAYAGYTADAFWPSGLAVFYPHPGRSVPALHALSGALLLACVSGVALWQRRRRPQLLVGWLWYVGMLVPVIGLVQAGQAARADRYLYLPLVGLWLAVVWTLFDALRSRAAARRIAAGLAVVWVLALAATTRAQIAHWKDSESLFLHALRVTDRNQVAHINLGLWLSRQGRLDDASRHLMAGLRASPGSSVGAGLLADVRAAQGRGAEAIRLYRRALQIDPAAQRWRRPLAALLAAEGREDEAADVLAELPPGRSEAPSR